MVFHMSYIIDYAEIIIKAEYVNDFKPPSWPFFYFVLALVFFFVF